MNPSTAFFNNGFAPMEIEFCVSQLTLFFLSFKNHLYVYCMTQCKQFPFENNFNANNQKIVYSNTWDYLRKWEMVSFAQAKNRYSKFNPICHFNVSRVSKSSFQMGYDFKCAPNNNNRKRNRRQLQWVYATNLVICAS